MMRTRTASTSVPLEPGHVHNYVVRVLTGTVIQNVNNTLNGPVYYSGACSDSLDVISDEQVKKARSGACVHNWKRTHAFNPGFEQEWLEGSVDPTRYVRTYVGGNWSYQRLRVNGDSWLSPLVAVKQLDWDQLSYESMREMQPKFSEASFANDLLELGQIKDLINPRGRRKGDSKEWNLKRFAQERSNERLWAEFGLMPLYSTLQEVHRLITTLGDTIKQLRKKIGKIQTRHYSRRMDILSSLPADSYVYDAEWVTGSPSPGFRISRKVRITKPATYHATLRFQYDISSFTDLELRIRAWSEAFGLNRPLSILWNAVPYSFVIDWFINVDEWVTSLLNEPLIPIIMLDYCHSVKYEYSTILEGEEQYVGIFPAVQRFQGYYERRVGDPCLTSRLEVGLPTVSQAITGLALGVSKTSRETASRNPPRSPWLNFGKVKPYKPR